MSDSEKQRSSEADRLCEAMNATVAAINDARRPIATRQQQLRILDAQLAKLRQIMPDHPDISAVASHLSQAERVLRDIEWGKEQVAGLARIIDDIRTDPDTRARALDRLQRVVAELEELLPPGSSELASARVSLDLLKIAYGLEEPPPPSEDLPAVLRRRRPDS